MKIRDLANILGVSQMSVSRWKNKNYFQIKKIKRRIEMSREIKNILLMKNRNKFTGIDKESSRLLDKHYKKNLIYMHHILPLIIGLKNYYINL